jgi:lipopolysaccharide export system protein LptA
MSAPRRKGVWLAAITVAACAAVAQAQPPAQQPSGPANALQGFAQNRDQPVKIDAGQLEVRDKDKVATFSGNVKVVQGDTTMRAKTLAVFYDGNGSTANALVAAKPGPAGQQKIRRLEAKGGVKVCQNDQVATGDAGIFDMQANTVMLVGNVVLTKEPNILRGDRLTVNLETGVSKIEGGKVQALIFPKSIDDAKNEKAAEQAQKQPASARKQLCAL